MTFEEAIANSQFCTRIVVFGPAIIADCLLHCLDFHQVRYGFYSASHQKEVVTDFQIFQAEEAAAFEKIQPNIALVVDENESHISTLNLGAIINGGALIYKNDFEEMLHISTGFYRKIGFDSAQENFNAPEAFLETDFGQIPVQITDHNIIENISGLKLVAQQMGIMEEDFYEALMEFS